MCRGTDPHLLLDFRAAFFEIEGTGKKCADGCHHRVALEIGSDDNGVLAEFRKDLATDAARRDGRVEIADNSDSAEFPVAGGDRREDRRPLRAIGGAIACVLDVAALYDRAVIGE